MGGDNSTLHRGWVIRHTRCGWRGLGNIQHEGKVIYAQVRGELLEKVDQIMGELSVVRQNIIKNPDYTPYCGAGAECDHNMPRTVFVDGQFQCACGWRSEFEKEFIDQHRGKK